jgi:hypothetical protein
VVSGDGRQPAGFPESRDIQISGDCEFRLLFDRGGTQGADGFSNRSAGKTVLAVE